MKKLLLFLFLFSSVIGYSQTNPALYGYVITDKPSGQTIVLDTLKKNTMFNIKQTTAGQTFTLAAWTPGTRTMTIANTGTQGFTIVPGGFMKPGTSKEFRWDGVVWSPMDANNLNLNGGTMTGDINLSTSTLIKNALAPNNYIQIGASGFTIYGGNSDIDLGSAQDLNLSAGSEVQSEVVNDSLYIREVIGYDDMLGGTGVAQYVFNINTGTNTFIGNDTSFVTLQSLSVPLGKNKNINVKPDKIYFGGTAGTTDTIAVFDDDQIKLKTDVITEGSLGIKSTYTGTINSSSLSGNRTYQLPNVSGDLALTSDIINYTSDNGITKASNNFKLGGNLTGYTVIGGNHSMLVGDIGNRVESFQSYTNGYIELNTENSPTDFNRIVMTAASGNSSFSIFNVTSGINQQFQMNSNGIRLSTANYGAYFKTTNITSADKTIELPNASGTLALLGNKLSDFASTTSAELRTVLNDETGQGSAVFATRPVFNADITTPNIKVLSTGVGLDLYNTSDTTTNYERLRIYKVSNIFRFESQQGGTGTLRSLQFVGPSATCIMRSNSVVGSLNLTATLTGNGVSSFGIIGQSSASTGVNNGISWLQTINQTSTSGYRGIWLSPFLQTTGSGVQYLFDGGSNSAADGGGTHTSRVLIDVNGTSMFGGGTAADLALAKFSIFSSSSATQFKSGYDPSTYWTVSTANDGKTTISGTGSAPELIVNLTFRPTNGIATATSATNSNFFSGSATAGSGVHASASTTELLFSNATSVRTRNWARGSTQTTLTANEYYAGFVFGGDGYTEAATGTHPHSARIVVKPPLITNGAGATDTTSTVLITGASSIGNFNYSLNVASGNSRFSGDILTFAGARKIGSGDAFGVNLVTNGLTRINISASGQIFPGDGCNFGFGSSSGNKLGLSGTEKFAFWGATPIVQPTTAISGATLSSGGGTALTSLDTFDGYTIAQAIRALKNMGLLQ